MTASSANQKEEINPHHSSFSLSQSSACQWWGNKDYAEVLEMSKLNYCAHTKALHCSGMRSISFIWISGSPREAQGGSQEEARCWWNWIKSPQKRVLSSYPTYPSRVGEGRELTGNLTLHRFKLHVPRHLRQKHQRASYSRYRQRCWLAFDASTKCSEGLPILESYLSLADGMNELASTCSDAWSTEDTPQRLVSL